ncbi:MAG: M23 family metallopeptidase [Flavobacteriales bacterium]|nr:M23 family metallopeptidase [Flavobacteriales bacterium]
MSLNLRISSLFILFLGPYAFTQIETDTASFPEHEHKGLIGTPLNYFDSAAFVSIDNAYGQVYDYGKYHALHPGIDFIGQEDQEVFAVKDGTVLDKYTTVGDRHWRYIISDGFEAKEIGYMYAHLKEPSMHLNIGDTVKAGMILGTLTRWSKKYAPHCHFSYVKRAKSPQKRAYWVYDIPLNHFSNFRDTTKPEFLPVYKKEFLGVTDTTGKSQDLNNLSGKVNFIIRCQDLANSKYPILVRKLVYQFKHDDVVVTKDSMVFDMPLDHYYHNSIYSIYSSLNLFSLKKPYQTIPQPWKGIAFYIKLIPGYEEVSRSTAETYDGSWDTRSWRNGKYILEVRIEDGLGNTAHRTLPFAVKN